MLCFREPPPDTVSGCLSLPWTNLYGIFVHLCFFLADPLKNRDASHAK